MSPYSPLRLIEASDDVATFDCGVLSLDEYLRGPAKGNHGGDLGRCYVTTHGGRVIGYYTLSGGQVLRAELPSNLRKNTPSTIPTLVIGRLAVDVKYHRMGLGVGMVKHAIVNAIAVADIAGFKMLVVHTDNDVSRAWWQRRDFDLMPENEYHLMLTLKDARDALGVV